MIKTGDSKTSRANGQINVAHVASGDLWAGAETQLLTLSVQLQQRPNIKLHICLLNYGELYQKLTEAGITVSVFNECELGTLKIGMKLYRTLQQFKPDVVHTHRLKENILGSVVALFLNNTPSIRTVHGAPEFHHGFLALHKRIQNYMEYLCSRYLQKAVIAVSEDLAKQLGATFPARKISTILNGIDRSAIESLAMNRAGFNVRKGSDIKICFAGRLANVKRLDLWLETAAILRDTCDHQFSFYIIGDGPEKGRVTCLVKKLLLDDCVHLLGEQKNVPALLKQMDLLLLTSDHEGVPMVILEALSLKTLVVAHSVGGITAVLDNGRAGYLVNRHDPLGYSEEILRSLDEPADANKKKEAGFAQVNSGYAAKASSEKYAAKYLELSR